MTATVDELCTLLESGWTPEQINRLVLVRWVLARDGRIDNRLATRDTLAGRIGLPERIEG